MRKQGREEGGVNRKNGNEDYMKGGVNWENDLGGEGDI
jgi:hypothetical protein